MSINAQVIKPNLRHFGQFPEVEVVNGDENIWQNTFLVCVDYFSVYLVIADHEQDALDILVDYFEDQDYTGYFLNENEIAETPDDEIITAGNHGRPIAIDQLIIEQI
jgi:hypothetical protein